MLCFILICPCSLKLNKSADILSASFCVSFYLSLSSLHFCPLSLSNILRSSVMQVPLSPVTSIINVSVYPFPFYTFLPFSSFLLVLGHYHPSYSLISSYFYFIFLGTISKAGQPKKNSDGFEATIVWVLKAIYIPKCCRSKPDFHVAGIEGTF